MILSMEEFKKSFHYINVRCECGCQKSWIEELEVTIQDSKIDNIKNPYLLGAMMTCNIKADKN